MTITQIDTNIQKLMKKVNQSTFLYDLMLAFGMPKSTVKRLQSGAINLSKNTGEVILKKKFLFKELSTDELPTVMEALTNQPKIRHDPRFVILTDYQNLLAYDTKTAETLETSLAELTKNYAFFLPLAGMEKAQYQNENPADVKAAEKMAKLFDEIKKHNPTDNHEQKVHDFNVFLTRLLFCFFAEDTGIFPDNLFTEAIGSHTQEDGSDLGEYLTQIFEVLNQEKRSATLPKHLAAFPYVNGGLFEKKHPLPTFSKKARKTIIECGKLDWAAINPDIFGSMIQAVVTAEHRGSMGMHYTSVPNIMKVIEPLFLNDLYEELEKAKKSPTKLKRLLLRLQNIKIFDPACGSGNFLIIAYKELRKLEMKIFQLLAEMREQQLFLSNLSLEQFYGIELDDFAHEVASLSLWLAEHQMNTVFLKAFGNTQPALPLREGGKIVHGNACRLDWEEVCPKEEGKEVFILGNPPYLGARVQDKIHKSDLELIFKGFKKYKDLDYITAWFFKGAKYIRNQNAKLAFVSTNSICQGDQVALLWKKIFDLNLEINFAHKSFKWTNNAKGKAAVIVIIVGISNKLDKGKFLYINNRKNRVKNINAYLVQGANVIVERRSKPISNLTLMQKGNMPYDGGNLILNEQEKELLIDTYPKSTSYLKKLIGAKEFINGTHRYCLWLNDEQLEEALKISIISNRISKVKEMRLSSSDKGANKLASRPHQFRETNESKTNSIIVPSVSSERREYIPIGFVGNDTIISNLAFVVYDAELHLFGILTSKIHVKWMQIVSGRLKSDYRYSSALSYNTFPFPKISPTQKKTLETHVYAVLKQRELHPEKTLAQLYDPDKMPDGLRAAHHELDLAVESCYRKAPFTSDEERLAYLFKLYEKMIAEEKERETLFAKEKKIRKRKKSKT